MATFKQTGTCLDCGTKNSITVITKQSKYSRSVKVTKCSACKSQPGVLSTLKRGSLS